MYPIPPEPDISPAASTATIFHEGCRSSMYQFAESGLLPRLCIGLGLTADAPELRGSRQILTRALRGASDLPEHIFDSGDRVMCNPVADPVLQPRRSTLFVFSDVLHGEGAVVLLPVTPHGNGADNPVARRQTWRLWAGLPGTFTQSRFIRASAIARNPRVVRLLYNVEQCPSNTYSRCCMEINKVSTRKKRTRLAPARAFGP